MNYKLLHYGCFMDLIRKNFKIYVDYGNCLMVHKFTDTELAVFKRKLENIGMTLQVEIKTHKNGFPLFNPETVVEISPLI